MTEERGTDLVGLLVDRVASLAASGPAAIAVDGPDAAGKTTLAGQVSERLRATGLAVTGVSVDDFHAPPDIRHRRGELSPEGYYFDTFDYASLLRQVLVPVRDTGHGHQVLLVEGVFLHRPDLRGHWDLGVYLDVPEAEVVTRAVLRDVDRFGSEAEVRRRYREKYLPGQRLYRAEARPLRTADVVVDHETPERPKVLRWGSETPQSTSE